MATTTPKCPECGYVAPNTPHTIQPLSLARIEHLLRTNDWLEGEEERDFRSFISDGAAQLARIRDRISNMKALLETLETTKEELELAVGAGKQILHPVRSLPTELLQKVFYHGAGIDVDVVDYPSSVTHSLDLKSPPWVYGRVCRRWKEVSQTTPEIWTRVKVQYEADVAVGILDTRGRRSRSVPTQMFGLSFMSTYLGRSGTLPLSVYIDSFVNSLSIGTSNYMYAISTLVTSHAHRWEFLFLGKGARGAQIDTKSLSEYLFPSLKSLCFVENTCSGPEIGIFAPQLTSWSTLGDMSYTANGSLTVFPSAPLRSLITEYSSFNTSLIDTLKIVSLLPHLQRLFIKDLREPNFAVVENKQPQITELRELSIDRSPVQGIQALLHSISCPSLTHFSVNAQESLVSSFQLFEMNSKFRLRILGFSSQTEILNHQWITDSVEVLTIRGIGLDPALGGPVLDFLQLTFNVRDMSSILHKLLHQIASTGSSPTTDMNAFPSLRRLELDMHPSSDSYPVDTVEELITVATSRSRSNLEILLKVNDIEARKIFTHPRIEELRSMLNRLYIQIL